MWTLPILALCIHGVVAMPGIHGGRKSSFNCPSTSGGVYPHSDNCNMYFECSTEVILHECPKGKLFNIELGFCYKEEFTDCHINDGSVDKEESRSEVKDIAFKCPETFGSFPHEARCDAFYECFTTATLKACKETERFNSAIGTCYEKNLTPCKGDHKFQDTTTHVPITKKASLIRQPVVTKFQCPKKNGLFPHQQFCQLYYECVDGEALWLTLCPPKMLFNEDLHICYDEDKTECNKRLRPDDKQKSTIPTFTPSVEKSTFKSTTEFDPNKISSTVKIITEPSTYKDQTESSVFDDSTTTMQRKVTSDISTIETDDQFVENTASSPQVSTEGNQQSSSRNPHSQSPISTSKVEISTFDQEGTNSVPNIQSSSASSEKDISNTETTFKFTESSSLGDQETPTTFSDHMDDRSTEFTTVTIKYSPTSISNKETSQSDQKEITSSIYSTTVTINHEDSTTTEDMKHTDSKEQITTGSGSHSESPTYKQTSSETEPTKSFKDKSTPGDISDLVTTQKSKLPSTVSSTISEIPVTSQKLCLCSTTEDYSKEYTNAKTTPHNEPSTLYTDDDYIDGHECPTAFGLYPHPTDKTKFFNCENFFPHVMDCPSRLVFNKKLERCDYE